MATSTTTSTTGITDNEMLHFLQQDEQRGFSRLYDCYSAALFGLITKWIRDSEVAQNLLQDTFIKAWRGRQLFDPSRGRLFTWLSKIAQHICIDHLRSKAHKQAKRSLYSDLPGLSTHGFFAYDPSPDGIGLHKLVNALSQEEKEVIELKYFKGYTQKEIAEIMNTPLGTVKTRMCRAIRNLKYFFQQDWQSAMSGMSLN